MECILNILNTASIFELENINRILAEWDPIGVGEHIASDEYKEYTPLILQFIENRQQLMNYLEDILINKMGIDYNPRNKEHLENLQQVCDKIIQTQSKQ